MAERFTQRQVVIQNLKDAGCDDGLIEKFFQLMDEERKIDCLSLLSRHRRILLDCCHAEQLKIDCLDYLIYQMKKDNI